MELGNQERKKLLNNIFKGVQLAVKRLRVKTKKEGGQLIVSINGKIKKIPAKDL